MRFELFFFINFACVYNFPSKVYKPNRIFCLFQNGVIIIIIKASKIARNRYHEEQNNFNIIQLLSSFEQWIFGFFRLGQPDDVESNFAESNRCLARRAGNINVENTRRQFDNRGIRVLPFCSKPRKPFAPIGRNRYFSTDDSQPSQTADAELLEM